MAEKLIGLGTTLKCDPAGTTTGFVTIASLLGISGPDATGIDIDTSTIDNADNFQTFQRGQVDPGTVTLTLGYDPADSSRQKLTTLLNNGNIARWRVTLPSTGSDTEDFKAYVSAMGREIQKDAFTQTTIGLKLTGDGGLKTGFTST